MDTAENKKVNLEDLPREDLIKKCKCLISLAQKAKVSKEGLQEENNKLKEELNQKAEDHSYAIQSIVDKLTEEKLVLVTQIETLNSKNNELQAKLKVQEENNRFAQEKLVKLETENTSYTRQVDRLTDENEQLLTDLSTLETEITALNNLGVQQQEQLLQLEKTNGNSLRDLQCKLTNSLDEIKKLNNSLKTKETKLMEVSQELQALKIIQSSSVYEGNKNCDIYVREINELKSANQRYTKEVLEIQNINEKLKDKVKLYHSKLKKFALTIKDMKEGKNQVLHIFKAYTEQIREWKEQLLSVSEQLVKLVNNLEYENKMLKESNQILNNKLASYEIILKQDNVNLNDALKRPIDKENVLAEESKVIIGLAENNKKIEEINHKLQTELHENENKALVNSFVQTEADCIISNDYTEDRSIDLKKENSELLLEMNQMNQALKERGEIIFKLEAHCEEMKKRLQLYKTQANENVNSINEKDEKIKGLTRELDSLKTNNLNVINKDIYSMDSEVEAGLRTEIEILKEKLAGIDNSYAESETMSTSTISKCEEANRLKDLEGPWEERYGKLRTLAIKLKAKIREQVITITEQQTEKEELQKKLSNALKTVQSLQSQIDCLQDDLDNVNNENRKYLSKLNSVAENISKDKQLLVENEETIGILKKEINRLDTEKQAVENWKKQVGAKVQTLRKELEAKNLLIKESEAKILKLEADLETKDVQIKNEQESHKQTKSILDQISHDSKKNSVLNLEMQDYEKSVKELFQKVEKQKAEISYLQTQFDMQKCTVNALREQNKLLEERIQGEEKNGNTSLLEITALKKKIFNLEEILQQKDDKILDITRLVETTRSENEELSTEISKVISEHQKSLSMVKSERDQLKNQTLSFQQSLRETQDMLMLKENELMVIRDDYENYKVRAQSVLKKNQNRDLGLEEKLFEELAALKSKNNELTNAMKELRDNSETNQLAIEEITIEKEGLRKRCHELEIEVQELKNFREQLANKYQKVVTEHAETVRNLKVHAETLSQCYRQQLSEQEVRHNREIIELQSRLDKAPSPIEMTPVHPNMPREEGEGSESIESNSPPNNVHPIPLERLLDSKSDDDHLKKQLFDQESKVIHLTALLSDTEQDLAKHVQMNKLLKEEIRRQQRSVEREKHAENLEYLKNVVLKFVTLSSGDERSRLVPVLNTILKLSPEETQKLLMVAKSELGIKGWASYLPVWSPNKPE